MFLSQPRIIEYYFAAVFLFRIVQLIVSLEEVIHMIMRCA